MLASLNVRIGSITIADPNGYVGAGGAVVLVLVVIVILSKAGLPVFVS